MTWFTWLVIAMVAVFIGYGVLLVVRPRRFKIDDGARLREKHQGEDFYRGGNPGLGGYNGAAGGLDER